MNKIDRFMSSIKKVLNKRKKYFNLIKNPLLTFSSDSDQNDANCYFTKLIKMILSKIKN